MAPLSPAQLAAFAPKGALLTGKAAHHASQQLHSKSSSFLLHPHHAGNSHASKSLSDLIVAGDIKKKKKWYSGFFLNDKKAGS